MTLVNQNAGMMPFLVFQENGEDNRQIQKINMRDVEQEILIIRLLQKTKDQMMPNISKVRKALDIEGRVCPALLVAVQDFLEDGIKRKPLLIALVIIIQIDIGGEIAVRRVNHQRIQSDCVGL